MSEEKKEEITISKESLESFKKELDALKKNNELLMQVADKKSLARYYSRHKEELPSVVKLNLWSGEDKDGKRYTKVIMGWRLIEDIVEEDPVSRKWRETQTMELLLEDKTTVKVPYATFTRRFTQTPAKVIGNIEEDGKVALKVVREDNGKEYLIGVAYVN